MNYQISNFRGNETYKIDCTGDAVVGDEVMFERAKFSGSFKNAKFEGFEKVEGKIISESYGRDKHQHTFTIKLADGSKTRIKGRNLYKNGIYRKKWEDEALRDEVASEKHKRGAIARKEKTNRLLSAPCPFGTGGIN